MDSNSAELTQTSENSSNDYSEDVIIEYTETSETTEQESLLKIEHIQDQSICMECSLSFPNSAVLDQHIQVFHNSHQCQICYKQFKTKHTYEKHIKSNHILFRCDCNALFSKRSLLKKHLKEVCEYEERFVCELCTFVGKSRKALYNHHVNLHIKPFKPPLFIKCPTCLLSLRGQDAYDEHQSYHSRMEQVAEKSNA